MSATINDGGPAFPQPIATAQDGAMYCSIEKSADLGGMSLRDWFAGQALAGWLASFGDDAQHPIDKTGEVIATQAYKTADAMLAARSKGGAA